MFCSHALAERIDKAEMRWSQAVAATVAGRSPGARSLVRPIAGGLAVFAAAGSPINKAIGIGFGAGIDLAALEAIEDAWRERGEPMRFELSTLADPSIAPVLTGRGYRLTGFENVLGRAILEEDGRALPPDGMHVAALAQDDWRTWLGVALDGFATPDGSAPGEEHYSREALEAIFGDVAATPGMARYLLEIDGVPAGAASVRIDGELAQLSGAATLPAFRRRGVQSALLARRIGDAARAGCTMAVITVQPGSKSHANAARAGFAVLYPRAILIRER